MNLELFPQVDPSELDALVLEIDRDLDASFLGDVAAAFESARDPGAVGPDAAA